MAFTMHASTINVFLSFHNVSLYLLFPGTVLCRQKALSISGKWFDGISSMILLAMYGV